MSRTTVFIALALLLGFAQAQTCRNVSVKNAPSSFLCAVNATALYNSGCDVLVEERLLYPYSTGEDFVRRFQLPESRVLSNFTAVIGNRTLRLENDFQSAFNLSMESNRSSSPVLVNLSYRLSNGLVSSCGQEGVREGASILAWNSGDWNRTIDVLRVRLTSTAPESNVSLVKQPGFDILQESAENAVVELRSVNKSVSVAAAIDAKCDSASACSKIRWTKKDLIIVGVILICFALVLVYYCYTLRKGSDGKSTG